VVRSSVSFIPFAAGFESCLSANFIEGFIIVY
jgi:hypothetical protein